MIRIIGKIPKKVTVACSGGVDSMSIVNFLLEGKRKVNLAFFNHDTVNSRRAQDFLQEFSEIKKLKLDIGRPTQTKGKRSLEEYWRDERYNFFNSVESEFLITCHHLDDCVETWLMSCIHGQGKLIPYKRGENIYRPFLMTTKSTLKQYAKSRNLSWSEDQSNTHTNFMRNHVRINMMPAVLKVNPGIRTTIRKKLIQIYKDF